MGVVEIVARVVAHQIARLPEIESSQARGALGTDATDLRERRFRLDLAGRASGGGGSTPRVHQPQPRRRRGAAGLVGPLQLMQGLASTAHQALALALALVWIAVELACQLFQQALLMRRQRLGRLTQAAAQKAVEQLAPPLQVGETAIRLQLQALLQRAQPGLEAQGVELRPLS